MDFKEKYSKRFADRFRLPRGKYHAILDLIKLRRPELPQGSPELPDNTGRKYPVFQELKAAKQEIQDEFSKMQLELADIKARLDGDIGAVSGGPPRPREAASAVPAKEPVPTGLASAPQAAAQSPVPEPAGGSRHMGDRAEQDSSFPMPSPGGWLAAVPMLSPARIFAAAAICAAAVGLFLVYGGEAESFFALPPTRAAGLCLDRSGEHVFFADPQRQLLFTVSVPEKRVKSMQSFPSQGLKGLAFDGTVFWSSDGTSIYRHGQTGNYAVLGVYAAGPEVYSISWDGKNLWSASAGAGLTRYSAGEALVQEAVYPMPAGPTAGISVSDGKLWLLDPGSGNLSAYLFGAEPELLKAAGIKRLLPRGGISGFSVAGDILWVVAEDPAELTRINLKNIKFH